MKKIIAGNWKLNKNPLQTRQFFDEFLKSANSIQHQIYFFPPATSLESTAEKLKGTGIFFGSQNCHVSSQGAFTGEISAQVVKDLGGQLVLVGHSERRTLFGETDLVLCEKLAHVQSLDLVPVFCIGENLQEREAGKTNEVLKKQIQVGLSKVNKSKKLVLAYEPVWAIGTGKIASIQQVQEAHHFISTLLQEMGLSGTAILYGGSVKPDNSKELLSIPHVDGFLVGGASLEPAQFLAIAKT